MKSLQIDESPKTFILVFETGDELAKGLREFAEQESLSAASFKAVGVLSSVRLGWLSWESKTYEPSVTLNEQVELLSPSPFHSATPSRMSGPKATLPRSRSKTGVPFLLPTAIDSRSSRDFR